MRYLLESLVIVTVFTYFFALQGLHLFMGMYRYRCFEAESGIVRNMKVLCGFESCPEGAYCALGSQNPSIPVNYDNFGYSYV